MIISKNIVFTNEENVLKADVVEIDTNKRYKNFYVWWK